MSKIKVKKDGSVYKLATGFGIDYLPNDLCTLFWKSIWHLIIISFVVVIVGYISGDLLGSLVGLISTGMFFWTHSFVILAITSFMILVTVLGVLPVVLKEISVEESTNPILKTIYNGKCIYKGWKDKFCPLVEEE